MTRKMERLTSYKSECEREMICRHKNCNTCEEYCPHINEDNCPCLQEVLKKLAEYEDLEEQGKLLKLPCAVGDKVYAIEADEDNFEHFHCGMKISELQFDYWMIPLFGKYIFLTKEEAIKGNTGR